MKYGLLLLLIACFFATRANDTLTRAQIYNFNVGDTFDYEEHMVGYYFPTIVDEESVTFSRCIISNRFYSTNNDTLFVIRNWVYPTSQHYDTIVIDSLQSPITTIPADSITCPSLQLIVDSATEFNHILGNEISSHGCQDSFYHYSSLEYLYCKGLGLVYSYYVQLPFEGDIIYDSTYLIYYSKGGVTWGTPYYLANGSNLIHYTPLPEECATWISTIDNAPCGSVNMKITSGDRISYEGHTYVEMNFEGQISPGFLTTWYDSLPHYYRNDTLNRRAYMYSSWQSVIDSQPYITYDFSVPAGGQVLYLSQVNVGGQLRTKWNEDFSGSYIEGVGGVAGLRALACTFYVNEGIYTVPIEATTSLTCFSVCGQTLYPYDSTGNCALAAISNIEPVNPNIKLYPNPNNGQFNVEVTNQSLQNLQLVITDITGREIKRCPLNNQLNNINIEPRASGLYIWQVWDGGRLVESGKLVKE